MPRVALVLLIVLGLACACSGFRAGAPGIPYVARAGDAAMRSALPRPTFGPMSEHVILQQKVLTIPLPAGYAGQAAFGRNGAVVPGTEVFVQTSTRNPLAFDVPYATVLFYATLTGSGPLLVGRDGNFSVTLPKQFVSGKLHYYVAAYDAANPAQRWQTITNAATVTGSTLRFSMAQPFFIAGGLAYAFAVYETNVAPVQHPPKSFELHGSVRQRFTYAYPSPKASFQPPVTIDANVVQYYSVETTPTTAPAGMAYGPVFAIHVTEIDDTALQSKTEASDAYIAKDAPGELLAGSIAYSFPSFAAKPDTTSIAYARPQQLMPFSGQSAWNNSPGATIQQNFADAQSYTRHVQNNGTYTENGSIPNPSGSPAMPQIVESPNGSGSYEDRYGHGPCGYVFNAPSYGTHSQITVSESVVPTPPPSATPSPCPSPIPSPSPWATISAWFPSPPPALAGSPSPVLYSERDTAAKNPTLPKGCGPASGSKQALLVTRRVWQLDTIVGFAETTETNAYYSPSGAIACMVLHDTIDEYYDWKGDAEPAATSNPDIVRKPYLEYAGKPIATVDTTEYLWLPQSASSDADPSAIAAATQAHFMGKIAHLRTSLRHRQGAASEFAQPAAAPPPGSTFPWASAARGDMTYTGAAGAGERMRVFVQVRMHDPQGLLRFADDASIPGSPNYRQFLRPEEIADRFLATKADYDEVSRYFSNLGLAVQRYPQRHVVQVTGTVAQMSRAFNTAFARFSYHGRAALGPVATPHFDKALPVASVIGLVKYVPFSLIAVHRANDALFAGYSPQQLSTALDYSGAYAMGYNGSGITEGVVMLGTINNPYDLNLYSSTYHWKVRPLRIVPPLPPTSPPATPTPPPTPGPSPSSGDTAEAALDTQTVAALAPSGQEEFLENYGSDWYGSVEVAIARNADDTISASVSAPEIEAASLDEINKFGTGPFQIALAVLASEGVAFFASSGDDGSADKQSCPFAYFQSACAAYPAADHYAVAVGGVNLPLDAAGNVVSEITAWSVETTHGGPPLPPQPTGTIPCTCVGSGGGYSSYASAPLWQREALANSKTVPFTGARELPDIAFDAAPQTGVAIVDYGLTSFGYGTSEAAPMANAAWALVLSACKQSARCATAGGAKPYRLGNPAPLLYNIYRNQAQYQRVFYDVLYGNNTPSLGTPTPCPTSSCQTPPPPTGYSAGKGYDLVTGLGVPFVGHLINAVVPGVNVP